tara:strand:- start:775 stop:1896 length:1122 start_codon:yes stop_codon:yes gene_type:complete
MTKKDSKFIPVFQPSISLNDKLSVLKNLNSKNISGSSKTISQFEDTISYTFERKYAVSVSNGSAALDLTFNLLNLNEDDEVIIPSFTIISCLSAVIRSGARPVFCDVDPLSWNMKIENVKAAYTAKTKCVLMVHTYGLTADAEEIKKFCEDKSLILIEDTAEAHGQTYNGKKCGTFGKISTLSFYANKHITTGEGGMILTDNEEIYKNALRMRNLDFNNKNRFQHDNLFWNYRLGGLQAALGISQTKNLNKVIEKKIIQAKNYDNCLKGSVNLKLPLNETRSSVNHYWVYGILLKDGDRDELQKYLLNFGIETRKFFWPLHLQNALPKKFVTNSELSVSENLGNNGIYIPLGEHVKTKDQNFIADRILNFFGN